MAIDNSELLALTAEIVSAHVAHNVVAVSDLPTLISKVYHALAGAGAAASPAVPEQAAPAVSVRSSVKPEYLVCLEDGQKLKMLKRHLMTYHQMTPAAYRARWGLPSDYPMSAPSYSAQRRALARQIGLGTKPADVQPDTAPKAPDAASEANVATPSAKPARRKLKISVA